MIKNIIFDIGNVLFTFRPEEYLSNKYKDKILREKLFSEVFRSEEWVELDRGTMTEEEAVVSICRRIPELEREVRAVFNDWQEILLPVEESIELLKELKGRGYGIYLLSNFHLKPFQMIKNHTLIKYCDGMVISAAVNYIKPEPSIYQSLLEKYNLDPGECIFIDDTTKNLEGARAFNIETIHFTNTSKVREKLKKIGIL